MPASGSQDRDSLGRCKEGEGAVILELKHVKPHRVPSDTRGQHDALGTKAKRVRVSGDGRRGSGKSDIHAQKVSFCNVD